MLWKSVSMYIPTRVHSAQECHGFCVSRYVLHFHGNAARRAVMEFRWDSENTKRKKGRRSEYPRDALFASPSLHLNLTTRQSSRRTVSGGEEETFLIHGSITDLWFVPGVPRSSARGGQSTSNCRCGTELQVG